jgi:hypothetical protein
MPTNVMAMLQSLSRVQIERLLKTKERIETLQSRREELRKELAQVDADLSGLLEGAGDVAKTVRSGRKSAKKAAAKKATAKKATAKKAAAKKVARGKTSKKRAAKASGGVAAKPAKNGRRKAAAAAPAKTRGAGKKATLEDVVYGLIEKRGAPVPFQVLLSTIMGKKLFTTRSNNFDNVLRRTLSTSTRIKRVGRGIYGI